jgi:Arc/MetJ-type ribon-helix-helix transcriptional regulator
MERTSRKKIHIAPLLRQERAMRKLLREGRYRNVTHFVRTAIDHYLDRLGRPPLIEQARQMAEDHSRGQSERDPDIEAAQDASRATDERW